MSWNIQNLSAQPGDQSVLLTWSYSNPSLALQQTKRLLVSYTDSNVNDPNIQTTATAIIPLVDASGNLATSFLLTGLVNGINYIANIVAHLLNNGGTRNSNTVTFMTFSVPPQPQTFYISNEVGGELSVYLSLSNTQIISPTPISYFDGFSALTCVYVTINNTQQMYQQAFYNDASNSLYTRPLTFSDLEAGSYEVVISLENIAGESANSPSQTTTVSYPIPGPPVNLQARPTMLIDPSFNPYTDPVSITLSWQNPLPVSPPLSSYNILRDGNLLVQSLPVDPCGNNVYVDNSSLVAGQSYTYTVESINSLVDNDHPANSSIVSVTALSPPTIIYIDPTSGNEEFSVDVSYNANGFLPNQITFDLSGNNGIGFRTFSQNPFTITNLTNGTTYTFQVSVVGTAGGLSFGSAYSAPTNATPYDDLLPVENFVVSNVDGSGNPLNGKLNLSWVFPTLPPAVGTTDALIYRKLTSDPDGSYNYLGSVASTSEGFYQNINLTNGTSYTYKIINSVFNTDASAIIYSTPVFGSSIPFTYPSVPTNLTFTNATMAYQFTGSSNNGGLPLAGYRLTLSNTSNGVVSDVQTINLTARDSSGNLITIGNVLSYVLPGRNYQLTVQAYVSNNNIAVYGSNTSPVYAFSTPLALNAPVVYNADPSGNPYNSGTALLVTWALNQGYDASNATYTLYRNGSNTPLAGATNITQTSFLDTGLSIGVTYYYQVVVTIGPLPSPLSPDSNSIQPLSPPNQPSVLVVSSNTSSSLNLLWDVDATGYTTNYTIYKNSVLLYQNLPAVPGAILNFDVSNNKWFITDNSVTTGVSYTYDVYAEKEFNGNYLISQPRSITSSVVAGPSQVQGLHYVPNNSTEVTVLWGQPSNISSAGIDGNSNLLYRVTVVNPDTGYIALISGQPQSGTSATISGNLTDAYGNQFTITNLVQYTVNVVALFYINNDSQNEAVSLPSSVVVQPRNNPATPTLTVTPINTAGAGQQLSLQLTVDPSANTNDISVLANRVITDVCGNTLATVSNQPLPLTFVGNQATYVDSPNSLIAYDTNNFLNGNVMTYTFYVTYNNWTVNYTVENLTSSVSGSPLGVAIINSIAFDPSGVIPTGTVVYSLNKNGATVNSLITIGFDTSNNTTYVLQENGQSAFTFSNVQINGSVARNQLATYTLSSWSSPISKALGIFSTTTSTVLQDTPGGSVLGD